MNIDPSIARHTGFRTSAAALSLAVALIGGCTAGSSVGGSPVPPASAPVVTSPVGTTAQAQCSPSNNPVLTFAAYSTPREAYGKIIPAFQAKWKQDHNQTVTFQESYGGSTAQAQNVLNGFEADIVALALAPDVDIIAKGGLITHAWTGVADAGMVSSSVVVFDVRPGNPKKIATYSDLTQKGLEILTPDPASSGGARWNIVAAYGAALRGHIPGVSSDKNGAETVLRDVFANVKVLDRSARDSIKNFESGNGDVAITYENEVLVARKAGLPDELVIPPSTILIENPAAVVDTHVDQHCVRAVAEGFLEYLHGAEAQKIYRETGFLRPPDAAAAKAGDGKTFLPIKDLFTVQDLGGWNAINTDVFGDPDGVFTKAFKASHQ